MTNSVSRKIALSFLLVALQSGAGFSQTIPSDGSSGDQERLALLPFETRGFSSEDGIRLKQTFATGLAESKRFDVMPDMVFKNSLEQASLTNIDSCNTLACIAQLGKVLNVDKVVHVQADRWEQRFMLHIRLVRSSDGALLYDERVDYSGEFSSLLSTVVPEQARKLSSAFLDKKPNWYLIAAAVLVGVGLIYWIYSTFASVNSTESGSSNPTPTPQ